MDSNAINKLFDGKIAEINEMRKQMLTMIGAPLRAKVSSHVVKNSSKSSLGLDRHAANRAGFSGMGAVKRWKDAGSPAAKA